jgi:hypothetical protein
LQLISVWSRIAVEFGVLPMTAGSIRSAPDHAHLLISILPDGDRLKKNIILYIDESWRGGAELRRASAAIEAGGYQLSLSKGCKAMTRCRGAL